MKKVISVDEALEQLIKREHNFNESVDVAVHFVSKDSVKSSCVFKHAFDFGRVLVFSGEPQQLAALGDRVTCGGEELVETIRTKKSFVRGYKYSVASPSMMTKLSKIARILGPRGLMPDAKYGLVSQDVSSAASQLIEGKLIFKTNKLGVLHSKIGDLNMGFEKLKENLQVFCESIFATRPKNMGLQAYIRSISVSSTMGKGYFVDFVAL